MASDATASDVTLVNSYTTGQQITPSITALTNGGWVVTWYGEGPGGDSFDIFQQRYAANGNAVGPETLVNSYTTGYQTDPSITALPDGGWVVTWDGEAFGSSFIDIHQQRYTADGHTVPGGSVVNTYLTGGQSTPTTTTLSDGGWVVAWQGEGADDSNGIFLQRYDKDGNTVGAETPVNTYTTSDQTDPAVTALAGGGWVVTWEGEGTGDSAGIFQQAYAADGNQVETETRVNDYTTNDQLNSSVAALADGGWVVTWSGEGAGDDAGVFQQRYAANGDTAGSETLVNSYITNDQSTPAITALADGGWVVTWQGEGAGGQGIFQQRYAANGDVVGSETWIGPGGTNPTVTAFASGGWEVTWQGTGAGDSQGIYQRHFAVDIVGTSHGDKLTGTSWSEYLAGKGGNDRLDGRGGDDVLAGGGGNDTYVVNSKGDQVEELASQGTDTVLASISYTLTGTVENLALSGKAGLNGTGNAVANKITGNLGANTLKGLAGADQLTGGQGNDKLYGGSESDHFIFHKGDGTDTVKDFDAKGADHDVIELSHISGISDFADLKTNHMEQVGGSVVVHYTAHDSMAIDGVKIKELSSADFQL